MRRKLPVMATIIETTAVESLLRNMEAPNVYGSERLVMKSAA